MYTKALHIGFLLFLMVLHMEIAEKIRYISTERPRVTYYNTKYFSFVNVSSRRFNRRNPFYYVDMHVNTLFPLDDNMSVHFYISQDISNGYFRPLFEIHRKWCNFITMEKMFGSAMRQGTLRKPCPHPPGDYHMYNMSIPVDNIPRSLPYFKGRIYCNATHVSSKEPIGSGYIDMDMKEYKKQ